MEYFLIAEYFVTEFIKFSEIHSGKTQLTASDGKLGS